MSIANTYRVVLESRGNKFCIYYKNSAIYCKSVDSEGRAKESILIDSVYDNFLYSKSQDDNIYLLCQGRNKNFLLFIFDGDGWHMEELYLRRELGSIIPLDLFVLKDGIHIIYAKKLSLEYYYDLFQLRRSKYDWEKNFICEIYSKSKRFSLDIKMMGYDTLHMISTLYNGETSSLSHYIYNAKSEQWINIPIVNLSHNNILIKVFLYEGKLNLFCYSFDNEILNLFYFTKYLKNESKFSLIDIIRINSIPKTSDIVIDIINGNLKISYIENNNYYENRYSIISKKLGSFRKIALDQISELYYTKLVSNGPDSNLEEREVICSISDKLEISLPLNEADDIDEDASEEKAISTKTVAHMLDQIDFLCEEIESINTKISQIEEKVFNKYTAPRKDVERSISNKISQPVLRESNFKENFMKSKPTSLKLDGPAMIISPFSEAAEDTKPAEDKKKEEVLSIDENPAGIEEQKIEAFEECPNKSKGIIKTVSEWFK